MTEPTPPTHVEERLVLPFTTPGLEALRIGVLSVICDAAAVETRARAVLLTAQSSDFRAVLSDVMLIPASLLAERIVKPRAVFAVDRDVAALRDAQRLAQQELTALGLSRDYQDLLTTHVGSAQPQSRVSAACATLTLAALLNPVSVTSEAWWLATENDASLTTQDGLYLEIEPFVAQPIIRLLTESGNRLMTEDGKLLRTE